MKPEAQPCRHLVAELEWHVLPPLPEGKRIAFGWTPTAITGASPLILRWPAATATAPTRLRFTVAIDVIGDRKVVASIPGSGRVIGELPVCNASVCEPCEITLATDDALAALREGVALHLVGGGDPLWIFAGGDGIPDTFRPHLLIPGSASPLTEFHARFASLSSIQQWGWMGGCVLDGLLDLGRRDVAQTHLDRFVRDGHLIYEGPRCDPADDRVYGIEGTLPFAALALLHPGHPLLELPLAWWRKEADADGAIIDWISTTSEGAYTIGYPLAVIARQRGDDQLARLALTQVRVRQARLFDGSTFWRLVRSDGSRANRNWVRGVAWQLLGGMRTLGVLRDRTDLDDLAISLARLAAWAQTHQRPDGLWSVFMDEPALTADTGGSAGVAAALAIGANLGLLPASARAAAQRCHDGLLAHLTTDGFLHGVSPSNKAGEELQRSSYRIIYPMGMGLMAQLIAALASPATLTFAGACATAVATETAERTRESTFGFPAAEWQVRTPASQGVDALKLAQAMDLLASVCGNDGTRRTMVIRNGFVIWQGSDQTTRDVVWSCTKSFTSTCLGLLWDDGKCHPGTLLAKVLPAYAKDYPTVTLEHLATFTGGVQDLPDQPGVPGPPLYAPGSAMHYSAQSDILAAALTAIAGETLHSLFMRRIGSVIGLTPEDFAWGVLPGYGDGKIPVNGGSGVPPGSVQMSARGMARFGWLYAHRGNWAGRQLISTSYIDYATALRVPASTPPFDPKAWYTCLPGCYGLNWWINGDTKGKPLWPSIPRSSFAAQGNRNNICIIIPEWDLVLVRLAQDQIIDVGLFDGALKRIGEAIRTGTPRTQP